MRGNYILVGQTPVRCDDLLEWARQFGLGERRVRLTRVGPCEVSTVFLGLDHQWGIGPPLVFETMIFLHGERLEESVPADIEYQQRYSTWLEAEHGHERAVAFIRQEWDEVEELYPEPLPTSVDQPG